MSSLMGLQGELMRPVKEANTASSVAHGSKEPLGIRFASLLCLSNSSGVLPASEFQFFFLKSLWFMFGYF